MSVLIPAGQAELPAPLRFCCLSLLLGLFIGCDSPTVPGEKTGVRELELVSGGDQTGSVTLPLTDSIVVRAVDADGQGVPGVLVLFTPGPGAGTALAYRTDSLGLARTMWTLGRTPGEHALRATVEDGAQLTIAATARPLITRLNPYRAALNSSSFTLTVSGAGFSDETVVQWNGGSLSTAFLSDTLLSASVAADLLTSTAEVDVQVLDPRAPASEASIFTVLVPLTAVADASRGIITAGAVSSCALAQNSTAYCWGDPTDRGGFSNWGPLGIEGDRSLVPAPVVGGYTFSHLTMSLGSHSSFSCGLDQSGAAYCWGTGASGQLGTGAAANATMPQPVAGGLTFTTIDAGQTHACALTHDGKAYCWGLYCGATESQYHRCGPEPYDTEQRPVLSPVLVEWPEAFVSLTSGGGQTCALTTLGGAVCWGEEAYGFGDDRSRRGPSVVDARAYIALSRGMTGTCGLTPLGRTICWSRGKPPTEVTGAPAFATITVGYEHACGLTSSGETYCWGSNAYGQLGTGTISEVQTRPSRVSGPPFVAIDAGIHHTCAVAAEGVAYCWGNRANGRIGDGIADFRPLPGQVAGDQVFTQLSRSCGLDQAGSVWCWGPYPGIPEGHFSVTPVKMTAQVLFTSIAAGTWHTYTTFVASNDWPRTTVDAGLCGLATDGGIHCTVQDQGARLEPFSTPGRAVTLVAGAGHHCMLDEAGTAYCWGANAQGQLGNGTTTPSDVPVQVAGGISFSSLAAGYAHTCGLTAEGKAYCWGTNFYGSVGAAGDGYCIHSYKTWIDCRKTPAEVTGGHSFERLFLDLGISCGLTQDGRLLCWGPLREGPDRCSGSLDAGSPCARSPIEVASTLSVAHVSWPCVLAAGGNAYCHGSNSFGQLGNGTLVQWSDEMVPVGGGHTFVSIGTFESNVCGLDANGSAYCWGDNRAGQLGDGTTLAATPPVPLPGLTALVP